MAARPGKLLPLWRSYRRRFAELADYATRPSAQRGKAMPTVSIPCSRCCSTAPVLQDAPPTRRGIRSRCARAAAFAATAATLPSRAGQTLPAATRARLGARRPSPNACRPTAPRSAFRGVPASPAARLSAWAGNVPTSSATDDRGDTNDACGDKMDTIGSCTPAPTTAAVVEAPRARGQRPGLAARASASRAACVRASPFAPARS